MAEVYKDFEVAVQDPERMKRRSQLRPVLTPAPSPAENSNSTLTLLYHNVFVFHSPIHCYCY